MSLDCFGTMFRICNLTLIDRRYIKSGDPFIYMFDYVWQCACMLTETPLKYGHSLDGSCKMNTNVPVFDVVEVLPLRVLQPNGVSRLYIDVTWCVEFA